MSVASKVTLGVAVTISSAIIGYVHYKQSSDRIKLHEGVIRDVEQQKRRQHENTYQLQKQIDITKHLVDTEHVYNNTTKHQEQQQSSEQRHQVEHMDTQ